jgi:hypothetical protein
MRRRTFIKRGLLDFIVESLRPAVAEPVPAYFASYESCYAILAETSLEELQADAITLGIDPAGKDKYQLAREIYGRGMPAAAKRGKTDACG